MKLNTKFVDGGWLRKEPYLAFCSSERLSGSQKCDCFKPKTCHPENERKQDSDLDFFFSNSET